MPQTVGVVTAFNQGNSGMYSVDLAAAQFCSCHGLDHELIVIQSHKNDFDLYGSLKKRVIRNASEIATYDLILYWGDFLNSPAYAMGFARREINIHNAPSREAGFDFWQMMMLGDPSRESKPSISVSNNFHGLPTDPSANQELSAIYASRFNTIFPRDTLSAEILRSFSPHANVKQGIDAAFLLDYNSLGIETSQFKSDTFCVFFHRSNVENIEALISHLETTYGLKAIILNSWLKCRRGKADRIFAEAISLMSQAKFIVSDTYHVLVNGLNLGIPVVGIGRNTTYQEGTLGDHKKKILFEMFKLDHCYVSIDCHMASASLMHQTVEAVNLAIDTILTTSSSIKSERQQYTELLENAIFNAL